MKKIEIAREVATKMNKINENIEIEKTAIVLSKGMTFHELECALRHFSK